MKKLFLIISIFILTVTLSAQEFERPNFYCSFDEALAEIQEKYPMTKCVIESETWQINDLFLTYRGKNVKSLFLDKTDDQLYTYTIFLENMNTNDWTNFVLAQVLDAGVNKYKDGDLIIAAVDYTDFYLCFSFAEISIQEDGVSKVVIIAKMPKTE